MNKQLVFILIFVSLPILEIYSAVVNLSGDTIVSPGKNARYIAESIGNGDRVIWRVINGIFSFPVGNNVVRSSDYEWTGMGPTLDSVDWDDIPEKGQISYRNMYDPQIYGYADVEILSVVNSQVDSIKAGDFHISQDIIYIPKGESGSVKCSAYMIFPACKGGSNTPVIYFMWQLPSSLGGSTIKYESEITINYNAYSGDGEKIIVTPMGYGNDGLPRSFTIKRMDCLVENEDITANKSFEGESLTFRNVNIFPGANVSIHGTDSVRLLQEFHAYTGSEVHITAGTNTNNINEMRFVAKGTSEIEDTFEEMQTGFSQNYPNPCSGNTTIDYCLPEDIREASLYVVSSTGQVVRNISIGERGMGVLNLDVSELLPGIYLYYIVTDGKMSGSKRMVIAGK